MVLTLLRLSLSKNLQILLAKEAIVLDANGSTVVKVDISVWNLFKTWCKLTQSAFKYDKHSSLKL